MHSQYKVTITLWCSSKPLFQALDDDGRQVVEVYNNLHDVRGDDDHDDDDDDSAGGDCAALYLPLVQFANK